MHSTAKIRSDKSVNHITSASQSSSPHLAQTVATQESLSQEREKKQLKNELEKVEQKIQIQPLIISPPVLIQTTTPSERKVMSKSIDVGGVFTMDVSLEDEMFENQDQSQQISSLEPIQDSAPYQSRVNAMPMIEYELGFDNDDIDDDDNDADYDDPENEDPQSEKKQGASSFLGRNLHIDDDLDFQNNSENIDQGQRRRRRRRYYGHHTGGDIHNDSNDDDDDLQLTMQSMMIDNYENPMPSFASSTQAIYNINNAAYQSRRNNAYQRYRGAGGMQTQDVNETSGSQHKLSASVPIQVPICKPRQVHKTTREFMHDDINDAYDSTDMMSDGGGMMIMDPRNIPKSIEALARSVRDSTHIFGDLPHRRFNTGDLVRSLRPI